MVRIEINTGNAAFEEAPCREVARILYTVAGKFELRNSGQLDPCDWPLFDINGNTVGEVSIHLDQV